MSPGCKVFRFVKAEMIGVPHIYKDQCTGEFRLASGWVHPGYSGHWYFKYAIYRILGRLDTYSKALVFRMVDEGVMG
jgi:hypothetical protein